MNKHPGYYHQENQVLRIKIISAKERVIKERDPTNNPKIVNYIIIYSHWDKTLNNLQDSSNFFGILYKV